MLAAVHNSRPHVLVLGAGAIGCLLAARLSDASDLDITLGARRPMEALRFADRAAMASPRVQIVTTPAGLPRVDAVVVATKAHHTPGLAPWFRPASCTEAFIMVAQNGVDQVERLSDFFPESRIAPLIVTYGAEKPEPDLVLQTLAGTIRVPDAPAGHAFAHIARHSTLDVRVTVDFATALWTKLAWNLVGNSLTTIANVPVCAVGQHISLRELATNLVAECAAVARANGADLYESLAIGMLDEIATYAPSVHTSMWQDRQAGRALEHQAIGGAVVRAGDALGIEVPYCRTITAILDSLS